ncbi:MAG: protein kinase [Planctomycetes bacterium]|nr:protein kinase [Planctomycetota bacterium]
MAVDPARAKTLFLNASDLANPAEQAAYLDRECAGNPELRARVAALLQAHAEAPSDRDRSGSHFEATLISGAPQRQSAAAGDHDPDPAVSQTSQASELKPTAAYAPQVEPELVIAGRYTLLQKIGEGGMGEVWVAKQTEPVKRKVALKLIKTGMDSKSVLQRFEQERQALAMMDHPHIAKVLDAGLTPTGQPFFVMELVNGLPLNKFCDELKLSPRERLELFVPICQAVQHAHQKGVVHRDLKPANILVTMIDSRPVPKVIDFGVAKATADKLTDETLSTQFGAVVGTLEYMSPEQAGFSGENVDTRADIYSLGVILYELLTGLRPIDAGRLKKAAFTEMIRIIQEDEPPKPSTRLSTDALLPSLAATRQTEPKRLIALLRGELDWVVMKCLEKQRDQRYETANGLARDIQRYLADEIVEARPPGAAYRLQKLIRRHKGQALAAGLVLLTLCVGVMGTTIGLFRAEQLRRIAVAAQGAERQRADSERQARADADAARLRAEEHERLARRRLYNGQVALAAQAIQNRQPTRALDFLETLRPGPGEDDLRGFDWHHLWHLLTRDRTHILAGHQGGSVRVSVTPDGKTVATADGAGMVRLWDAETGRLIRSWSAGPARVLCHAFSANGLQLACGDSAGKLTVWDVASQSQIGSATLGSACVSVAWLPGRELFLAACGDLNVQFLDADGNLQPFVKVHANRAIDRLLVSDDGKFLLTIHNYGGAVLFDLSATPPRTVRTLSEGFGGCFSPDGTSLAAAGHNRVVIYDLTTGNESARLTGQHGKIPGVAFSPDGSQLLSACLEDRSIFLWDLAQFAIVGQWAARDRITDVRFVRRGRGWAVTGEGAGVELWQPDFSRDENPSDVNVSSPALIAPDGVTLWLSGPTELRRWNMTARNYLAPLPPIDALTGCSRDGSCAISVVPPGHALGFSDSETGGFGEVTVWDFAAGRRRFVLPMHAKARGMALLAPNGKWVCAGNDRTSARWWDISGPQPGTPVELGSSLGCLGVSPDSATLAVGEENGSLQLWDVATRTTRGRVQHGPASLSCIAFSPDGDRLMTADEYGTIRYWDAQSLAPLGKVLGSVEVVSMVFFPDGQSLACGRHDGTIQIVDAITLQERITWKAHGRFVTSLAVTPDGGTLVSGTLMGPMRIWRTEPPPIAGR